MVEPKPLSKGENGRRRKKKKKEEEEEEEEEEERGKEVSLCVWKSERERTYSTRTLTEDEERREAEEWRERRNEKSRGISLIPTVTVHAANRFNSYQSFSIRSSRGK
jgi:hypothetical protein